MTTLRRFGPALLAIWIAFVFLQSLFFKFAGAAEPQYIFGTLEQWAIDQFGISGLFTPAGVFGFYGIGIAELIASVLVLVGVFAGYRLMAAAGGLMAAAIMAGAIFFHLFTPLGVVVASPENGVSADGGLLFGMAVLVLASGLGLGWLYRDALPLIGRTLTARQAA